MGGMKMMKPKTQAIKLLLAGLCISILFAAPICDARGTKNADAHLNTITKQLEGAVESNPGNYALYYYLGNAYLRANNRDAAIQAWDVYLAAAPVDSRSISIRERLTILKMAQARELARKAAKLKAGDSGAADVNNDTIAVLDFKNMGSDELTPFIKGLTAMIITDLSKVPQLKVVERARMQALMDEMKLAQMGVIDPATTARMGRLLQARTIDWGELAALSGDMISIKTVLSDTLTQDKVGEKKVEGNRRQFFELEKQLVFDILAMLGIKTEELDEDVLKAIKTVHTQNYDAFISYGRGLDFLDKGDFSQAKDSFETAAQLDPDFDLAETAEISTPRTDDIIVADIEPAPAPAEPAAPEAETTTGETDTSDEPGDSGSGTGTTTTRDDDPPPSVPTPPPPVEDIAQDTTLIETCEPYCEEGDHHMPPAIGPDHSYGYFTNILKNANGLYHGLFHTPFWADLAAWSADSTWFGDWAEGDLTQITSLTVGGNTQDLSADPNNIVRSELGRTEYMVWGTWADSQEMVIDANVNPASPGSGHYRFDPKGYYVYGDPIVTDPNDMTAWSDLVSSDKTLTYSGDAYGTHTAAPDTMMTGTFAAQIDIASGQADVRDFDLSVSGGGHSASIENGVGSMWEGQLDLWSASAAVDGQPTQPADRYWVSGALYGPTGEEIGGIFFIEKDAGDNAVHGMYRGGKDQ